MSEPEIPRFEEFFESVEPRLRKALVAAYGLERGREATAAAFAWAWEHRDRLAAVERPVAYLYRVGQSRSRGRKQRMLMLHGRPEWPEPWFEPELAAALRSLTERQRVAVVLVHGYAWTLAEVGDLLGLKVTTVQNHLERGLARLRSRLEVTPDA